jgi:hypothetical protein
MAESAAPEIAPEGGAAPAVAAPAEVVVRRGATFLPHPPPLPSTQQHTTTVFALRLVRPPFPMD